MTGGLTAEKTMWYILFSNGGVGNHGVWSVTT